MILFVLPFKAVHRRLIKVQVETKFRRERYVHSCVGSRVGPASAGCCSKRVGAPNQAASSINIAGSSANLRPRSCSAFAAIKEADACIQTARASNGGIVRKVTSSWSERVVAPKQVTTSRNIVGSSANIRTRSRAAFAAIIEADARIRTARASNGGVVRRGTSWR